MNDNKNTKTAETKTAEPSAVNAVVICNFWGAGLWQKFIMIASIEIILQGIFFYFLDNGKTLWHLIGWSIFLIICIIALFVKKRRVGNYI